MAKQIVVVQVSFEMPEDHAFDIGMFEEYLRGTFDNSDEGVSIKSVEEV